MLVDIEEKTERAKGAELQSEQRDRGLLMQADRRSVRQTDRLNRMLTERERGQNRNRQGYEDSADILSCTVLCFSLLRMLLSIVKCLCFAGGGADVHSEIIASLIKGPPHGASSCCQAICSKGKKD